MAANCGLAVAGRTLASAPVHDLLRVGPPALKKSWSASVVGLLIYSG
ncbi:hypothetical protein YSA_09807 [Pseudomonas putida ND6]|uniref:Uncharacterized protein n=1 Tax=Pseudomonas putida ND6 TaxID=231023 RepID=I3V2X3_PSEPU|nr:hypothetical protein YSA_09807 [Pseudomonas putida ND6]